MSDIRESPGLCPLKALGGSLPCLFLACGFSASGLGGLRLFIL